MPGTLADTPVNRAMFGSTGTADDSFTGAGTSCARVTEGISLDLEDSPNRGFLPDGPALPG